MRCNTQGAIRKVIWKGRQDEKRTGGGEEYVKEATKTERNMEEGRETTREKKIDATE